MNTEHERRMQSIGLYIICLYSPKVSFKKHIDMIKEFITEMINGAILSEEEDAIESLTEFNELFDYFIDAERLKDELIELESVLETGKFKQEKGAELLLDSIKWHHQFESVMKQMKGRKNYKVFESFYNDLLTLYHKVTAESDEIITVIQKTIEELNEQN
jgi:hypothetical protein